MRDHRARFVVVVVVGLVAGLGAPFVNDAASMADAMAADPPGDAKARDASVDAAPARSPISKIPPDPAALRERAQWVFDLRWSRGDVFLVGVHRLESPTPQETPRAMGRFALELFEGPTLIERVRFDFPLLGDEPRDAGSRGMPYFGKNLTTRIGVMFPATGRGTRLQLWDRATDERWDLSWPPIEGVSDAGAPATTGTGDAGRP